MRNKISEIVTKLLSLSIQCVALREKCSNPEVTNNGGQKGTAGGIVLPFVAFVSLVFSAPITKAENEVNELEEITVTAQRRSENVQDAAVSIDVLSSDDLMKASATSLSGLTTLVPSLQASDQLGGFTVFYMRGIGSFAVNGYSETAVAFNLNEVYLARSNGVNGQFFDIERVEALKGPQGTLYGRNATGGAINLITRRPELGTSGGYFEGSYGDYDSVLLTGAANAPLGDDGGLRFAFQTEDRDGYYDDGTSDVENRSFRLSLAKDLTPDVTIDVIADYSSLGGNSTGVALLPLGTTPVRGGLGHPAVTDLYNAATANQTIFPGAITPVPQYLVSQDVDHGGIVAKVNWQTRYGDVTFIPAYREMSADNFSTTSGFWIIDQTEQEQESLELRFASDPANRFRYLIGGYYFDEVSDFYTAPDTQYAGVVVEVGRATTESAAAFSQVTYDVTEAFRLTGGMRYTSEKKGLDGEHSVAPPAVFTSGPGLDPLVIGNPPVEITVNQTRTFNSTDWKVGIEWDAGPDSLIYANVGTGFKSGGFFFASDDATFDPEEVTSYIVGTKNRFLNGRFQANAEAYYMDYENQQLAHLAFVNGDNGITIGFPTENVGKSTIYGLETDFQFLATDSMFLSMQLAYTNSNYDRFSFVNPDISPFFGLAPGTIGPASECSRNLLGSGEWNIDCSDKQLIHTPTWTVSGSIAKTFDLKSGASVVAELRSRYEGKRWAGDSFVPEARVDAETRTDIGITYVSSNERLSVTTYVNNIEDTDIISNVFLQAAYPVFPQVQGTLRPPRVYGVRARINF
jgi:iron complex outermembrane receptor protein